MIHIFNCFHVETQLSVLIATGSPNGTIIKLDDRVLGTARNIKDIQLHDLTIIRIVDINEIRDRVGVEIFLVAFRTLHLFVYFVFGVVIEDVRLRSLSDLEIPETYVVRCREIVFGIVLFGIEAFVETVVLEGDGFALLRFLELLVGFLAYPELAAVVPAPGVQVPDAADGARVPTSGRYLDYFHSGESFHEVGDGGAVN